MSRRKWSLLIGLIGSVAFNVGWWISYPPMVFAGVLMAGWAGPVDREMKGERMWMKTKKKPA